MLWRTWPLLRSAWYLLSALGLYQLVPGSLEYSLGSPLFRHVRLTLDSGNILEVRAPTATSHLTYLTIRPIMI